MNKFLSMTWNKGKNDRFSCFWMSLVKTLKFTWWCLYSCGRNGRIQNRRSSDWISWRVYLLIQSFFWFFCGVVKSLSHILAKKTKKKNTFEHRWQPITRDWCTRQIIFHLCISIGCKKNLRAAMWEHASSRPAMRSQWAQTTTPSFCMAAQVLSRDADSLCERYQIPEYPLGQYGMGNTRISLTLPSTKYILVPLKTVISFKLFLCMTTRRCYEGMIDIRILYIRPVLPIQACFRAATSDRSVLRTGLPCLPT